MSSQQPSTERTVTDDRIDANREPAIIVPATRDREQAEPGGLPPGMTDDSRSPLDAEFMQPGATTDPV